MFSLNKKHYLSIIKNDFPEIDKELTDIAIEREKRLDAAIKKAKDVLKSIGIEDESEVEEVFEEDQISDPEKFLDNKIEKRENVPFYKRAMSFLSVSKINHPATVAAKQKINRNFDDVASGQKSLVNSSLYSKGVNYSLYEHSSSISSEFDDTDSQENENRQNKKFNRNLSINTNVHPSEFPQSNI